MPRKPKGGQKRKFKFNFIIDRGKASKGVIRNVKIEGGAV